MRSIWALALLVLAAAGCDSGSDTGFRPTTGTIQVQVYFDRDGTKSYTIFDTLFAKVGVVVRIVGNGPIIESDSTDQNGIVIFRGVPLGHYEVEVDNTSVGDSVVLGPPDTANLVATDTVESLLIRTGYREWSIREARSALPGTRVFLRGLLTSMLQTFRDTTVHLADTSGYLRLTRAGFAGSSTGNFPGDSVTLVATVGARDGQPTGDNARIVRLATRPAPVPISLSSTRAASADTGAGSGAVDAALVQVTAEITDTTRAVPYFKIMVDDGSGPLQVVADITFVISSFFAPGKTITVTGVLVPTGTGSWVLKPRSASDIPPPL